DLEILAHAESTEHGLFLRHIAYARANALLGPQARDVHVIEGDAPAARRELADDGLQQCRFAGAVATQDRDRATSRRRQIDAEQHLTVAVRDAELTDLEERGLRHECDRPPAPCGCSGCD